MLQGQMMDMPLNISALLRHAERYHGDTEIVSRTIEDPKQIHRYNYGDASQPIQLFVDEAAECCNSEPFIQLLNKGRGSGFNATILTQTYADFAARLGSEARARQVLANVNNLIALRIKDGDTQKYICEALPTRHVRQVERSHGAQAPGNAPVWFAGTTGESLKESEVEALSPQLLGCLPNLEFFGVVSAGRIIKGRCPILSQEVLAT